MLQQLSIFGNWNYFSQQKKFHPFHLDVLDTQCENCRKILSLKFYVKSRAETFLKSKTIKVSKLISRKIWEVEKFLIFSHCDVFTEVIFFSMPQTVFHYFLGNTAHSVENKENTFTCKILRENSIRLIWYVDFTEFLRKIGVSKFFQFPHSVDSLFRWITFVTQKVTEKKANFAKVEIGS